MRILTDKRRYQSGYSEWRAWDDGSYYYSDDLVGRGETEQEAINDLREQISEVRPGLVR